VLVLLIKFGEKTVKLVSNALVSRASDVITNVLSLVDLSLIASLLMMVMFSYYEIYRDLRLILWTSVVAISAIHVLAM
jgi:uncharacterized membrane protein YqhA